MAAGRKYKCFSNRRLNSRFLFVGCGGRHRQRWGRAEVGEAGPAGTIFRALLFLSIYFFLCLALHCLPACLPWVILLGQFVLPHLREEEWGLGG